MKASELRDKSIEELREEETRLRTELFETQFKHGTRQLGDTASIGRTRKDLARTLTVLRQKETAAG